MKNLEKQKEKFDKTMEIIKECMNCDDFMKLQAAIDYGRKSYSIEEIARGLTHYCFRNGPVEDMHANGKY